MSGGSQQDDPRDSLLGAEARGPIDWLRSPLAVRARCTELLDAGIAGRLDHFEVAPERMGEVARRVARLTRARYPDLRVPWHSHWRHLGAARAAELDRALAGRSADERARARVELAIVSVLLDTLAGPRWRYVERDSGERLGRTEGLAAASFRMFLGGTFSSDPDEPLRADASGLDRLDPRALAAGLQATQQNPIGGLDGRAEILARLGSALRAAPHVFGTTPRLGGLYDHLADRARQGRISARRVLAAVLEGLGPIWPGRIALLGVNLGDTWPHPAAGGGGEGQGLVPFHGLSQWVVYSLIEPLEEAGLEMTGVDELTGLAEHRNGGLFVDGGVLRPRHDGVLGRVHPAGHEIVVEWRALTIALLDRCAQAVRAELGVIAEDLPMSSVLEGGTWAAGREIALEARPDGGPPIRIDPDGTVL